MQSQGNTPKNGKPTDGFYFTTMLQRTDRFWSRKFATLERPPYSPDLAPTDFHLFPRLQSALKGFRFCDSTDIIKNATEELKSLPQNGFLKYFQNLYRRRQKFVNCTGNYFE